MPVRSFEPAVSVRGYLLFFLSIVFILVPGFISANESNIVLHYAIDRTALPNLNEYDLTLIISVGDAQEIVVEDGFGEPIPFEHFVRREEIMVTSAADQVIVELVGVSNPKDVGEVSKARLKDNKRWAWSHAFDDNHYLDDPIEVMLKYDLPATMYVVGDWINFGEPWEGDLSAEDLHELMARGWSIGNHTAKHDNNCGDQQPSKEARRASIIRAEQSLDEVIVDSPNPDYKVLSFAVPCGGVDRFKDYHELILEMRDSGETDILFSEGGHENPLFTDVAPPFDFNRQIKRDLRIDGSVDNGAEIMDVFDSIYLSTLPDPVGTNEIIWYNSFSHNRNLFGDNVKKLDEVAYYFVYTYGKQGSDVAWMAPADVIYSYLLNRDLAQVTLVSNIVSTATPTATPALASTPTPSVTHASTNASPFTTTPTKRPTLPISTEGNKYPATSTPYPIHSGNIGPVSTEAVFLPLIGRSPDRP